MLATCLSSARSNLPSISEQYMMFESTSLRHEVSTAEKLGCLVHEIPEKGRIFAAFGNTNRTRENDLRATSRSLRDFSPQPRLVVRFQEFAQANAWRLQRKYLPLPNSTPLAKQLKRLSK
jgi:hypothetical protein